MAVNILVSYAFHARTDLAKIRRSLVCGLLMIDSGAFTAHSTGKPIDRAEYAAYLQHWSNCWDHAITLDVIGDPVSTRANTRWLHEQGLPVMPVFTPGDTLADFDAMVRDHSYVCVGGLVGTPPKTQLARVRMLQQRAQRAGGGIHALGIGSLDTLRAARPYSSDSSNISTALRFGTVVYFNGHRLRYTSVADRAGLSRNWQHIRAHGIDLAGIAKARRLPGRTGGQYALLKAMSVGYASADELLKVSAPAPTPGHGRPGQHLYNSLVDAPYAYAVASLDTDLHSGDDTPSIWSKYAHLHICYPTERTPHAAAP